MNFGLRGSRGDLEAGTLSPPERGATRGSPLFPGGASNRPGPRQSNPAAFLVTILLLFLVLNSQQVSPNFLLWVGVGVFFMVTSLRMYSLWHQVQSQLGGATVFAGDQLRMSQGMQLWSLYRGPRDAFTGLRLQLALLERDFDELDYDALRALDPDNPPDVRAFSEAEINALPCYPYKTPPPPLPAISDPLPADPAKGVFGTQGTDPPNVDELTCSVCLENVTEGELVRTLPCLHGFHQKCVDRWLRQQATCPVCKFKLGTVSSPG
ncbi:RING/U-box superfamily protein [Klebsormidium nitens]|uniref:RING-type E3 ubiquitin transferase n=1 Tax=Klebsormidium nitens TaxID=105231 RepID=A0A1Y1IC77_KLENI|nr:RING/U-box superfamily protein [Klebsormidium nitens]|eukprot:GAQ87029.1 RING/U-box superfamily protein [Klebsormidium nitens]